MGRGVGKVKRTPVDEVHQISLWLGDPLAFWLRPPYPQMRRLLDWSASLLPFPLSRRASEIAAMVLKTYRLERAGTATAAQIERADRLAAQLIQMGLEAHYQK